MSRKSMEMPPRGALIWPSSEVPVPNGTTGTRRAAQMRTISCTSAVACGNTTASGGWFSIHVVVLPCCSRTACEVTSRLPNFAARAATTSATARASRRTLDLSCAGPIRPLRKSRGFSPLDPIPALLDLAVRPPGHDRHGGGRVLRRALDQLVGIDHVDEDISLDVAAAHDLHALEEKR